MQCNSVYNLQEMDACPKCNSTYILVIDQTDASTTPAASAMFVAHLPPPQTLTLALIKCCSLPTKLEEESKPSTFGTLLIPELSSLLLFGLTLSIEASKAASPAKYVYQEEDDSLDVNKQMYLRMTFFKKDDSSEAFLTYLKTMYIPYNEAPTKETYALSL